MMWILLTALAAVLLTGGASWGVARYLRKKQRVIFTNDLDRIREGLHGKPPSKSAERKEIRRRILEAQKAAWGTKKKNETNG